MLKPLFVSLTLSAMAVPAMAQDVKQEVEKIAVAYQDCVSKQDAACIAALYTKDGVQINPGGVKTDLKATYEQNFKNGTNRIEIRMGKLWPINNDLVLGEGETDVFGKNDKGEPTKVTVFWSAVDARENGQMKIRMLTVAPKPAPAAKEASADKK